MPAARIRIGEITAIGADLGLSPEDGVKLTETALGHFDNWAKSPKSTGFADGLSIIVELNHRFKSLAEEETLLKLATVYFTMNDENPKKYNALEQQAKIDAWDIDREAKDFFLCRAVEITEFFGTTSDKDILMYLKQNQPGLKKAAHFLKKSGLKST